MSPTVNQARETLPLVKAHRTRRRQRRGRGSHATSSADREVSESDEMCAEGDGTDGRCGMISGAYCPIIPHHVAVQKLI